MNSHNRIEIYIEITNFSCMKSIIVIEYCLFVRRRHVGMADDADSKSVGRKPVWVQVPLPALHPWQGKVPKLAYLRHFWDFFFYRQAYRLTDADTSWSPGFIVSIISSRRGVYVLLKKQMIYCMM